MVLHKVGGYSLANIRKRVPGVTAKRLAEWEGKLLSNGNLEDSPHPAFQHLIPGAALATVQHSLTHGGQGTKKAQSLRRAYPGLRASGAVVKSIETVRKALIRADWGAQPIKAVLPLTVACKLARFRFTRRHARSIASTTSFSDSKHFCATHKRGSKLGSAWAPNGAPTTIAVGQGSNINAHVYGAVTRYGATPLFAATGSTGGLALCSPGGPGAHVLAGQRARGVTCPEYRYLLENGHGGGLLHEVDTIFRAHGVLRWRWQQDGARAHSTANTANGRATRALITARAALLEPWPAHSPDLSPIEKAWAATEAHLHAHETWHDHASFLAAIRRAWAAVVTPAYCQKLFAGLRATYSACSSKQGAQVSGWGPTAK